MNIGEEYGSSKAFRRSAEGKPTTWRDTHLRVVGPAVWEMAVVFSEGWYLAGGTPFRIAPLEVSADPDQTGSRILVLDSAPGRGHQETAAILAAIFGAARQRIWITNAYFAPRDAALGMPKLILPSVQVNMRAGHMPAAEDNGIAYLKIPPFIVTLGFMRALYGLNIVVTSAKPIYFDDQPKYSLISPDSSISALIPGLGIPNAVFVMVLLAIVAGIVLNRTILGRFIYALGSNEEAVRLSGVNVNLWKVGIYALSGMICGIAGLLLSSRLGSAQPAIGMGYELDAIAATVIGGTSLAGGRGTILGTIIGAFIISILSNGLTVLSVADEWKYVATGFILVTAVYVDMRLKYRG